MAVAYERFEGQILADEDDVISSGSEDSHSLDNVQRQLIFESQGHLGEELPIAVNPERLQRVHELLQNKWPLQIGGSHIAWGIILLILGLSQIVVIPLVKDHSDKYWTPKLDSTNCYGLTLWSSLLMLTSGTLGLRAAIYRSTCNLYSFASVIVLETLVFVGFMFYLAFHPDWRKHDLFPPGGVEYGLSITCVVAIIIGFLLAVLAFIQYYEEVFCGELQLCRRCVHCCIPCVCPRAVSQEELLTEESPDRPPSLPV